MDFEIERRMSGTRRRSCASPRPVRVSGARMKRASTDPASNGAQKHARGSGDGGGERDDVDEDALVRDAENAYDDDDVGGGRGGAEEYDDDVDFDEEEVYARTGGGRG